MFIVLLVNESPLISVLLVKAPPLIFVPLARLKNEEPCHQTLVSWPFQSAYVTDLVEVAVHPPC